MICTVVGFGVVSGTSKKTGVPYEFLSVSLLMDAEEGYSGSRSLSVIADKSQLMELRKNPLPFKADVYKNIYGNSVFIKPITR